jgi:hypothetical protein
MPAVIIIRIILLPIKPGIFFSLFFSFYCLSLTCLFSFFFPQHRMKYCRQVIALALNIKNHFDRVVHHQHGKPIKQCSLPLEMPAHMQLTITSSSAGSSSEVVSYQFDSVEDYLCEKYPCDKSRNSSSSAAPALSCSRPKRSSSSRRPKRYEDEDDSSEQEEEDDEEEEYGTDGDSMDNRPSHHQQRRSPRKLQASPKIKIEKGLLQSSSPRPTMKIKKSYKTKPYSLSTSCHSHDDVTLKRKRGRPPKNRSTETNKEEEVEWTIHSPMDEVIHYNNRHYEDFENDFQPIVGEDSEEDEDEEEEVQLKKRRFNTPGKLNTFRFNFYFS